MDRRVWFFASGSVIALSMAFVALEELRHVPIIVSIVYAVLTVAVYFDWRSREAESRDNDSRR